MTELIILALVLWFTFEVTIPLILNIGSVFILLGIGTYQWLKNNGLLGPLIFIVILAIMLSGPAK